MTVSYPLEDLSKDRQTLENDFLPIGYEFVRFGTKNKKSMFLRSICYLTIKDYRKSDDYEERKYILNRVKGEMIQFLKDKSPYTEGQILERLKKETQKNISSQFGVTFHFPESGGIIGSYFSFDDDPGKGYPFFSEKGEELRTQFKPNSNIFAVNKFKVASDYMAARIDYRRAKNELQDLAKLLEQEKLKCDYVLGKTDEFKTFKGVLEKLDPLDIIDIINTEQNFEMLDEDYNIFCSILKVNICILRAWSDNVSVENYFHYNPSYPTILIFVVREGSYGLEGKYTDVRYTPGGILVDGKVKYFLEPDKDELIIYQLMKYDITSNSKILEGNYISFLEHKKRGKPVETTDLEKIDIPEYGRMKQFLIDDGDVDQIGKIIGELELV